MIHAKEEKRKIKQSQNAGAIEGQENFKSHVVSPGKVLLIRHVSHITKNILYYKAQ